MPSLKIFFRYLFLRICVPFLVCLVGCTIIWVMVDLYGNISDFFEHKVGIGKILYFYGLQIPSILVQVLPATMLSSTLWTLMSLNRRSELVALQAGGMAPLWIFSPFIAFAMIWVAILAFDMNWPMAKAAVTRERILQQVKGQDAHRNVFVNLPYVDRVNHRIWFFQKLDLNQGEGKGVEFRQCDDDGHDMYEYFARTARWSGGSWQLSGVQKQIYGADGNIIRNELYQDIDLDIPTSPQEISLFVSQPEDLTVSELSEYIRTVSATPDHLAKYRTEWWYRVIYPFSLIVLMLFALVHGMRTDRRNPAGGVMLAILVLVLFIAFSQLFLAFGIHNRLPPFVAVAATEVIFGGIALYLLALNNGWWWQLIQYAKRLRDEWASDPSPQ